MLLSSRQERVLKVLISIAKETGNNRLLLMGEDKQLILKRIPGCDESDLDTTLRFFVKKGFIAPVFTLDLLSYIAAYLEDSALLYFEKKSAAKEQEICQESKEKDKQFESDKRADAIRKKEFFYKTMILIVDYALGFISAILLYRFGIL